MGVGTIDLWDFDKIEESNLGTQGWAADACGEFKTDELSRICRNLNPELRVSTHANRWCAGDGFRDATVVFVCVDSLPTRQEVSDLLPPGNDPLPGMLLDTRMGARALRIVCPKTGDDYRHSLPTPGQVYQAPCTERATFFCAAIAAGMACNTYIDLLRKEEPPMRDFMLNLKTCELFASEPWEAPKAGPP